MGNIIRWKILANGKSDHMGNLIKWEIVSKGKSYQNHVCFFASIDHFDLDRTQFVISCSCHLDGVRKWRLGRLGHEGDQEGGEESDYPEHHQGDLGAVHLEFHDKRRDLRLISNKYIFVRNLFADHRADPGPE